MTQDMDTMWDIWYETIVYSDWHPEGKKCYCELVWDDNSPLHNHPDLQDFLIRFFKAHQEHIIFWDRIRNDFSTLEISNDIKDCIKKFARTQPPVDLSPLEDLVLVPSFVI